MEDRELIGYRLKNEDDRDAVDKALFGTTSKWIPKEERADEYAFPFFEVPIREMPRWDNGLYFIRGHLAGCLVIKAKREGLIEEFFEPVFDTTNE